MKRLFSAWFLACLVLLVSFALLVGFRDDRIRVEPFQITLDTQQTIAGRLHIPSNSQPPFPGVILCHGVSSSKDTLAPLAIELARNGIASITFDFGGYGESYRRSPTQEANIADGQAVLDWVKHHPLVDPQQLGIGGHSMGGITALEIAKLHPELRTTIVLGIAGEATPALPQNLLFASGVYEELNPVPEMRRFFADAVVGQAKEFVEMGDFSRGTARSLIVSSTSDHAIAPYDPFLIHQSVQWALKSFELPASALPVRIHWYLMGQVLGFVGAIGVFVHLYCRLLQKIHRLILLFILAPIVILPLVQNPSTGMPLLIGFLIVIGIGHYVHYCRQNRQPFLLVLLLYAGLIYCSVMIAVLLHALVSGSLLALPQGILGFPQLMALLPLFVLYNQFYLLKYSLLSVPGLVISGGFILYEIARPGSTLKYGEKMAVWLVKFMGQPLHFRLKQTSKASLFLLPVLLVVMVLILFRQWQDGFLTLEAVLFVAKLIGFFVLIPTALVVMGVRSSSFKALEARLSEGFISTT